MSSNEMQLYTPDLISSLPPWYSNTEMFKQILNSIAMQMGTVNYNRQDLLDQFFVDTATWGLGDIWEKPLGIETNLNKPLPLRRSAVKAKLRGTGTTTVSMIKNVVESYENTSAEVIQHPENYSFEVNFIVKNGITNIDDLSAAIEEIKPAHLAVGYELTSQTSMNLYYAAVTLCGEIVKVYPWQPIKIESKGNIDIAMSTVKNLETTSVYPRREA